MLSDAIPPSINASSGCSERGQSDLKNQRANLSKGFTLIEILVVITIISIIFTLVVISIRTDSDSDLKQEARRFAALTSLARQEAVLKSQELAIELTRDAYNFLVLEDQQWVGMTDDVLSQRNLPEKIFMTVYLEGDQFEFDDISANDNTDVEKTAVNPRVYILSSGEMMPFEVLFQHEDSTRSYTVKAELNGKLLVEGSTE